MTITLAFITAQYCDDLRRQAQSKPLLQNDDVEIAVPSQNIHAYISFVVSRERKINACVSHFEITNAAEEIVARTASKTPAFVLEQTGDSGTNARLVPACRRSLRLDKQSSRSILPAFYVRVRQQKRAHALLLRFEKCVGSDSTARA
jgi:hypothetical protein